MRTIYIVSECEPYESPRDLRAFMSSKRAQRFAERVRKHNETKPSFDPDQDEDWYDYQFSGVAVQGESYEEYEKRCEGWMSKHPIGERDCKLHYYYGGPYSDVTINPLRIDMRK